MSQAVQPRSRGEALRRMLEARSVAVIGASAREGSVGRQTLVELLGGGFDGEVFPVNPRYDELHGLRCYPTIGDVGRPVDLAIVAVGNAGLEGALREAAEAGAASAVIFASCHEEPRPGLPPLTERLAAIAREHGMALCGGNGMGFVNLERNLRACGFYEPKDLERGPITFVSHSGSAFSAMLHNRRGLRFNLAVSAGQELATTAADYLRYALSLASTRVVALFLETVRDVPGFRAGLEEAARRDVPIVALKVGREELTRRLVLAHSGALAGEDGAYEALFEAHGVLRVGSLDEMADTLALLVAGRRAAAGGLAAVHDSGGERALLIDTAAEVGVPLAEVSRQTSARLADLLDPGLDPVNPLDFWGTGHDAHDVVTGCLRALLDDPAVGALAFCVDLTTEDHPETGYIRMAREVYPETSKPVAMLANLASGIDRDDVQRLHEAGIPTLEGTRTGLLAFRHLFELRDHRALPPVVAPEPPPPEVRERWAARLGSGRPFTELEALGLLADHDVPVVEALPAASREEAGRAAVALGFPVALKTAAPGVSHKSEVGGVRLALRDERELAEAYEDLAARLGPEVTVARMAPPGVEVHLGIVRDEQFGPLVMVAAGGALVEVLRDRRLGLPPLDEPRARRMVDRLRVRPLLDGVRGGPPADVDGLIRALVRLSALAADLGERIEALDANPVICGPGGCLVVDALVVPRAT